MNIYISGSMAFDRVSTFPGSFSDHILPDKIHMLNVSFMVDGLEERFGGTAGNVAYSLALLGKGSTIMAAVGKDFATYKDWLEKNNVKTEGLTVVDEEFTAGAFIMTDKANNQITSFNPGAMKFACDYSIAETQDVMGIVSPGNLDDMVAFPEFYRAQGIPFIYDPGQQIPVLTPQQMIDAITGASILISNDYELEMIMKATGKSKEELLELCDAIVTTLGENGCIINNGHGEVAIPAVKLDQVVDPTGAGDAFRSGFLYGLSEGKEYDECARIGTVCASYCVEKNGTQEHFFTPEDFKIRYDAAFGA